jgi:hypothetical protein
MKGKEKRGVKWEKRLKEKRKMNRKKDTNKYRKKGIKIKKNN